MKHVSNLARPRGHITFTCRMFVYLWESSLHHRSALLHYVQAAVNLSSSEISRSPECAKILWGDVLQRMLRGTASCRNKPLPYVCSNTF
jgi:hypothetical protein